MSTDPYTLMLIGIAKTRRRGSKKKKLSNTPNSFTLRPKHLRSITTETSSKKIKSKTHFSYPSLSPITRGKPVDIDDTKVCSTDASISTASASYTKVLSLQSFSSGRASVFKLRGAGPRVSLYGTYPFSEPSKGNLTKNTSSPTSDSLSSPPIRRKGNSSDSLPSLPNRRKGSSVYNKRFMSNDDECELLLENVNSSDSDFMMSSVVELPGSPSLRKVEKQQSGRRSFTSVPDSLQSAVSDWRDCFVCSDADEELSIERPLDELTLDSNSSWDSIPSSEQKIPGFESSPFELNELELPPSGMVCVAWVNTRTGNRFINLPLNTKLESVRVWLGTPLPIVIEEDGRRGRLCDSKATLIQTVRNGLDPSKEGIGFFIGPVDGNMSYVLKVCNLNRLYALRPSAPEEAEKLLLLE